MTLRTEEFLKKHGKSKAVSFHMPGHKGSDFFERYGHGDFLDSVADMDITEIYGADNLFHDDGILRRTAEAYCRLYGVKRSFLLVNGTSGGIIASILATVPSGGKIVMARNCHKSVYNALRIGNIKPIYVYPSLVEEYGISGGISSKAVAQALDENPDASAVILASPNYYGICSDIESIAREVHQRDKVLIVDQAHGAHLNFMDWMDDMPVSAEKAGADLIINSTHKTLASFTQSAVLNLNSDRVSQIELEDRLQIIQSSSPSYLLMGSLDVNASIIEADGDRIFAQWLENVDWFYREAGAIVGINLMDHIQGLDRTKINIDASGLGFDGALLEKKLRDYNIYVELSTGNIVMCMTGMGTSREHLEKLLEALRDIADHGKPVSKELPDKRSVAEGIWSKAREEIQNLTSQWTRIPLKEAAGRVAAGMIIPYPPGIPLVCRGELIDAEDVAYLSELVANGVDIIGIDNDGYIRVVDFDE